MKYPNIQKAVFQERCNRFVARVLLNEKCETVHVKNTGRCKELLLPGAVVYLTEPGSPGRKTRFDLVAVEKECPGKGKLLINMDSQIPNAVIEEWLPSSGIFSADAKIRREVFYGSSRFDIFVQDRDRKAFFEVKGVTLEKDGLALFPDAPTLRGVKHIKELQSALKAGYEAYLVFLIQMKGPRAFSPNETMHPEFAEALKNAVKEGVTVLALDSVVTPDEIHAADPVSIFL